MRSIKVLVALATLGLLTLSTGCTPHIGVGMNLHHTNDGLKVRPHVNVGLSGRIL